MNTTEQKLDAIFAFMERLSQWEGRPLPRALTYEQAARELSISRRKLGYMIAKGQIATVEIGDGKGIPSQEVIRITTPKAAPTPRRSGGRPKVAKHDPQAELAKSQEAIKAFRKKRR